MQTTELDVTVNLQNLQTYPYGGGGGNAFPMRGIRTIAISGDRYVDALILNGQRFGGDGGTPGTTLTLAPDEYIVRWEVGSGQYVDYLSFTTNKGQNISGGGGGGTRSQGNGLLAAIGGSCDRYLDNISLLADMSG